MASSSRWRRLLSSSPLCYQLTRRHLSSSFGPPPPVTPRRVVVTGIGMVTPLGCGVQTTWKRLIEGECGVRAITLEDLKMNSSFDRETQLYTFDQLTSKVAAVVPCGTKTGEFNADLWLNSKEHRSVARFIGYALCAADEALKDAKWAPTEQEQKERTGVSIGGGIGSITDVLEASQLICEKRLRRLSPFFIPRILINMASGHVSMKYGFQGPNHAAVTACATGAHSIGDAARMIQFGDSDVMVAGGTESSIDALSIAGFCRSRALTTKHNSMPLEASRPFDCDRDGFVIGEGSGVLVLEELEHAKERGAKIYAEIRGYGMSGDAYHITQPHNDGRGAVLAMTRALKQSGLHPNQVDYINAHATSTPLGDAIEAIAIKTVFSEHATSGALAFSSTKGAIGHLLGAAGAVEAIFAILAVHHGIAPLTLNLNKPDPLFKDNFMPLTASKEMLVRAALSNSFGFGGTNASLLFTSV
ncbi:PREDICTED: 3-oxoacyl-[acyl-carrier-protein] synthase, mitochondrial isoform X1 [Populus euphratica]|uniref:3-oxoacyl-[acyl-carrier-protein] synthase, mitochondrial n=1 Tax=Populus euphratica TaxID=75702 RepID=A0AAJ6V1P5_POPEU|nr:PREDICTED: 3-oxoacyl-[acyl-carrier-protein] synthase, mitochondrial isoform X1 [Populus euphratica]XP_011039361.1 PREDICTED: 3-oxoacyl-[acyl-carrier-protein] synthase, mitochondrial isoform X1 [Populus euphratica]XP_011039362.1 PREDICTED: 3-oxoacyl-[acyl-carrier-protein] synthase, mitochondrial isoform X1 [Populus euphratica]